MNLVKVDRAGYKNVGAGREITLHMEAAISCMPRDSRTFPTCS